jgi:hypothetical protein
MQAKAEYAVVKMQGLAMHCSSSKCKLRLGTIEIQTGHKQVNKQKGKQAMT